MHCRFIGFTIYLRAHHYQLVVTSRGKSVITALLGTLLTSIATCPRFCKILRKKLTSEKLKGRKIYHCCLNHPHRRTNAAVLMGAFQILELGKNAEEAYRPFRNISPVSLISYSLATSRISNGSSAACASLA